MEEPPFDMAVCLERVAAGDQEAARALVARCHPLVWRVVHAHRAQSMSEDDLAQEVFLTLFSRLDRYRARDGIPFEHWLARVAVNACKDALTSERRRPRQIPLSPEASHWLEALLVDRAALAEETLGARELVELLLAELPPADRLLLTWLHLEERSLAEVSALTGSNRTLLKVRAFRARRRLRAAARRLAGHSTRGASR
jgi:RNA polymerase sigma factor (sigma-70 family)